MVIMQVAYGDLTEEYGIQVQIFHLLQVEIIKSGPLILEEMIILDVIGMFGIVLLVHYLK